MILRTFAGSLGLSPILVTSEWKTNHCLLSIARINCPTSERRQLFGAKNVAVAVSGKFCCVDETQENFPDTATATFFAPNSCRLSDVGQFMRAIDNKQWFVFHSDVTRIGESPSEPANVRKIILLGVRLLHQDLRVATVP